MRPGDAWRARINLWLGSCDAAVLVLSNDALKSSYVAFETNVLGYRWACDHTFRIVPVLVDVTPEHVAESALNPSQVSEWQAAVNAAGQPSAAVAEAVEHALRNVVAAASRPIERLARVVGSKLPALRDDKSLRDLADLLKIDLQWEPHASPLVLLAMQLLGSGMSLECASALRMLIQDVREFPRERIQDIVELIACAWVDIKADEIPKLAQQPAPPALILNAKRADIARMYVRSARHRVPPIRDWYFAEAKTVLSEQASEEAFIEQLAVSVRSELFELLGVDSDEELIKALDLSIRLKEPIVIALQAHGLNDTVIGTLRSKYPGVTFFLMTADCQVEAARHVHVIQPLLRPGDETQCLSQYQEFKDLALKRRGNV